MSQSGLFGGSQSVKFDTLDALIKAMTNMNDDLLADAGTRVVISRGNPNAKILLVGEAPGPQENIDGVPFIGRAGKMLDKILEAADFDSQNDIYITNSVFRMPPGENGKNFRKPTTQEIEYYRPYTLEIIRLVSAPIVLLMGNVACQSILGKTGITRLRGQWIEMDGRWIMPIFHPSYLLRNPSKKPGAPKSLMWDDIREVRQKYDVLK
ncbi:MAG: uracil-DNA glycosylase [Anaerolineae bacterium]|jgi:DNA polymerase|nr:uracil-DNA glycosylase [Anaerolineae bacterium]MBT3714344.1 uracil-DNA glycosylase [Anaerolineae bacterium]MBT4308965.1 uracil-DNA glycosylase [Anaerolineae bacterium]MBT4841243.1 uracil-DNA glycosylase [Anaerolineae bacterium]MBT6060578.1 uracil-DNA glycosylase [Anaerolineae bacterium]